MLSSAVVPADSVRPAAFFLDFLNTPAALTAIRITLVVLALGVWGMYLYARKKSREEGQDAPRS